MEQQLKEADAKLIESIAQCRQSTDTTQKQKCLNRLLFLIQQLPGIYSASHQDYPEAYNRTLEWACKNIDRFEPTTDSISRSMVIWINGYLKWRIRDLYISDNSYDPHRVYPSSREDNEADLIETIADPQISLSLLDTQIAQMQAEKEARIGNAIANYIKQDSGKNDSQFSYCQPHHH
ncbi:hypothetical protein I4641_20525 [Waterburya agarophytonicola K14]|uniref:Uncharacterized protein n=1 Tax=Waterburya agarophytonicola KI4 TaxID=2874699 RepID=A0A964FGU8_9CYAN|nr:hypothetical protein [Waterburya agarophytonicola]MCC0179350.1 hypothetical protein [Waterburya agarophytonicola KI4]